jgi:hypothetical protein
MSMMARLFGRDAPERIFLLVDATRVNSVILIDLDPIHRNNLLAALCGSILIASNHPRAAHHG